MAHPTGESESDTLRLDFDRRPRYPARAESSRVRARGRGAGGAS